MNSKLALSEIPPIENLDNEMSGGVRLIQLLVRDKKERIEELVSSMEFNSTVKGLFHNIHSCHNCRQVFLTYLLITLSINLGNYRRHIVWPIQQESKDADPTRGKC